MDLVKTYGEGIMKAIIEAYDDRYLRDLEDIQRKHQNSHQQAMIMGMPPGGFPRPFGAFPRPPGDPVRFLLPPK